MGNGRAEGPEAYLRLLGEAELRRAGDQLRDLDAADEPSYPGMTPFAVAESTLWKVGRAGRILVAVGAVDEDFLVRLAAELHAAMRARSRGLLEADRVSRRLHAMFASPDREGQVPSGGAGCEVLVTPVGRALRVADDRAPATLHLMSLVRAGTEALITVAMRMHWRGQVRPRYGRDGRLAGHRPVVSGSRPNASWPAGTPGGAPGALRSRVLIRERSSRCSPGLA